MAKLVVSVSFSLELSSICNRKTPQIDHEQVEQFGDFSFLICNFYTVFERKERAIL